MSRKRSRAASPQQHVRAMPGRERILLVAKLEMANVARTWAKILGGPAGPVPLEQAREILARELPYFDPPPRSGVGRPRDPRLDRAARLYVAAVRDKDALRQMGFGGFRPEKDVLDQVMRSVFPEVNPARVTSWKRLAMSIKNAARKHRHR